MSTSVFHYHIYYKYILVYSYKQKRTFLYSLSSTTTEFAIRMLQKYFDIDDAQLGFEPNRQSFGEQQQQAISESLDSQATRLAELSQMYERLVNSSKHFISKLCFLLSNFIPNDSYIKLSFNFIQKVQQEWKNFNNQNHDFSYIVNRLQSGSKVQNEKSQKSKTKLGKHQIKIPPITNVNNLIKSQVSTRNFFPSLSQMQQNTIYRQSKQYANGSLINVIDAQQQQHPKSIKQPQYKIKLKDEFYHIRQFVIFWLYPRLELHQDKILQKKMILNCYFAWNRKVKREIQITETSKIQMELTVQIKLKVPSAESKFRIFKGLGFKEQYIRQMNLTDQQHKNYHPEQEVCLEENSSMDPLDEILILARRQKNAKILPFNEQKMIALDRALGLI